MNDEKNEPRTQPVKRTCVVCFGPMLAADEGLVCSVCQIDNGPPDEDERDGLLDAYEVFHD